MKLCFPLHCHSRERGNPDLVTKQNRYFVYLMANGRNGTLYVGVTSDLTRRAVEHLDGAAEGFTKKYGIDRLVWFEEFNHIDEAITREKQIKKWRRAWKLELIEAVNPEWTDLSASLAF